MINCLKTAGIFSKRWQSEFKLFEGASQTCSPRRERKQHRRRRLRKRHLKSEVALLQTLSRLFHLVQFVKCWQFFLELNSKRLILVSSVFVSLDQRSKTATAHLAKPACAVRDEESRYGIVKDCIKVQEKKKEVVVLGSSPPKNVKLGIFRRSRAMTAKKSTKKRDARFANLNQLLFCSFR